MIPSKVGLSMPKENKIGFNSEDYDLYMVNEDGTIPFLSAYSQIGKHTIDLTADNLRRKRHYFFRLSFLLSRKLSNASKKPQAVKSIQPGHKSGIYPIYSQAVLLLNH